MVIEINNTAVSIRHIASIPDNAKYDKVYLEDSPYQHSSLIEVIILNEAEQVSAIIGYTSGATGLHQTSFVTRDDQLILCCSNHIVCLSIPDLNLIWSTAADDITCFEIFKHQDKYIVHGELLISCLDYDGQILWQQGGADIFVTPEDSRDFKLYEKYILATDWDYNTYKFDYDGNIL